MALLLLKVQCNNIIYTKKKTEAEEAQSKVAFIFWH